MKLGKLNIHVGYLNKDKDRGRREYEYEIMDSLSDTKSQY